MLKHSFKYYFDNPKQKNLKSQIIVQDIQKH